MKRFTSRGSSKNKLAERARAHDRPSTLKSLTNSVRRAMSAKNPLNGRYWCAHYLQLLFHHYEKQVANFSEILSGPRWRWRKIWTSSKQNKQTPQMDKNKKRAQRPVWVCLMRAKIDLITNIWGWNVRIGAHAQYGFFIVGVNHQFSSSIFHAPPPPCMRERSFSSRLVYYSLRRGIG